MKNFPRSAYWPILNHSLHVTEWGDPLAPPIIMWHGLSRTGRDFDALAHHLSAQYFVLCPDTIGRGLSSWSSQPEQDYLVPAYIAHAMLLMDVYLIERCAWIGTSMGGIVGMGIASGPYKDRIGKLVLNDIGGEIHAPALERIKTYVIQSPDFATLPEFETYVRKVHAPFGTHTDRQWRQMAETSHRRLENGRFTNHFDPKVMEVFANAFITNNPLLWDIYDTITCPTLLLRGEHSDLLLPEVAEFMKNRGPCARLETIPGCGHAPGLNTPDQIRLVEEFLAQDCTIPH